MSCVYLKKLLSYWKPGLFWKTVRHFAPFCLVVCLLVGGFYVGTYTYYAHLRGLNCPVVQVGPSPVELPLTALASFPGSGNTWIRHVVQQTTGLATGAVYCARLLRLNGFPWECFKNGSVILIKTHEENLSVDRLEYQRIVILLRNPFDAFRAEFNRAHSNKTAFAPKSSIRLWPEAVRKMAAEWQRSLINWMNFKGPIHVIRYESLLKDLTQELKMLFQFLKISVWLENIQCAALHSEGIFHRKKKVKSMLHFDKSLTKLVQSKIDLVSNQTNLKLDMYTDDQGQAEAGSDQTGDEVIANHS